MGVEIIGKRSFINFNDVGILSALYYRNNIKAIMDNVRSINLGTVYETVVARELKASLM